MKSIVSLIVPIYKVESYLPKCIDSILAQTYPHLEIILVDDGSPDNCPSICDAYAEKDSRIRVIHKPNGGVSSARNAGLDIATGAYVQFVDSDDCIDANMVETMVNTIEAEQADIVTVNLRSVSTSGQQKEKVMPIEDGVRTVEKPDYFNITNVFGTQISIFPFNSLYKMSILAQYKIRFLSMKQVFSEDQLFNLFYYAAVKKAVYISAPFYTYQVRENTLSRSSTPPGY